jgi:predicted protein tyrosine phosphatase
MTVCDRKIYHGEKIDFLVLNQQMATTYEPTIHPALLISISSINDTFIEHADKYLDILRLKFHDIDREFPGMKLINEEDAIKILDFVNKYIDQAKFIVVHCNAGIPRSSGVAAALSLLIQSTEGDYYSNRTYYPNIAVKSLIVRTAINKGYLGQLNKTKAA